MFEELPEGMGKRLKLETHQLIILGRVAGTALLSVDTSLTGTPMGDCWRTPEVPVILSTVSLTSGLGTHLLIMRTF